MKKAVTMFTVASAMLLAGVSANAANHATPQVGVRGPLLPVKTSQTPSGGASGLTITAITVGPNSGVVPGYYDGFILELPVEVNTVPAGEPIITTVQMQDNFFSGTPTIYYAMLQGGKVVSSSSAVFSVSLSAGYVALQAFNDMAPLTNGPAQVLMELYDGSTKLASSTYNIFIY